MLDRPSTRNMQLQREKLNVEAVQIANKAKELETQEAWLKEAMAQLERNKADLAVERKEWQAKFSGLHANALAYKAAASKKTPVRARVVNNVIMNINIPWDGTMSNPIYDQARVFGFWMAHAVMFDYFAGQIRLVDDAVRHIKEGVVHTGAWKFEMLGCLANFTKVLPSVKYETMKPGLYPIISFKLNDTEIELSFLRHTPKLSPSKVRQRHAAKKAFNCRTASLDITPNGVRFFGNSNSEQDINAKTVQFINPKMAEKYFIHHPVALLDAISLEMEGSTLSDEVIAQCDYVQSHQEEFAKACAMEKHRPALQRRLLALFKVPTDSSESVGHHLYVVYLQLRNMRLIQPFLQSGLLTNKQLLSIHATIYNHLQRDGLIERVRTTTLTSDELSMMKLASDKIRGERQAAAVWPRQFAPQANALTPRQLDAKAWPELPASPQVLRK